MSGDPWDVLHQAAPSVKGFDLATVAKCIARLIDAGLIEQWREDDGTWWIHVCQHDQFQSNYFKGKRGRRQSPIPPSQRRGGAGDPPKDPDGTGGSRAESSASEAEGSALIRSATSIGKGEGEDPSSLGAALGPHHTHLRHVPSGSSYVSFLGHMRKADKEAERLDELALLRASRRDLPAEAHPVRHAQKGGAA
jgi:hypothetical protein